jgi:DNA gyrase inhibitor GyrI
MNRRIEIFVHHALPDTEDKITIFNLLGESEMTELEVRIVRLEPMRVACVNGYSETPEEDAWNALMAWAKPKGLLDDGDSFRIFGFNNPNPSHGTPKYGYEIWLTVGPEIEPEDNLRIHDFSGGLYAVTQCIGIPNIGKVWKQLVAWRENSKYKQAYHQWLEEHTSPLEPSPEKLNLDLYLPITE